MKQEHMVILLLVFVLEFLRMINGPLIEGYNMLTHGDECYDDSIGDCPGGKVGSCSPYDG